MLKACYREKYEQCIIRVTNIFNYQVEKRLSHGISKHSDVTYSLKRKRFPTVSLVRSVFLKKNEKINGYQSYLPKGSQSTN